MSSVHARQQDSSAQKGDTMSHIRAGLVGALLAVTVPLAGCAQMPPPFEAKVVNIGIVQKGQEVIIDAIRIDNGQSVIVNCSLYYSSVCAVLAKGDTIRVTTDYHNGELVERIARGEG